MIIQHVFHTYKNNFPILSKCRLPISYDGNMTDSLITGLILELSELTLLPRFSYITRHINDTIPQEQLEPFLGRFPGFVDLIGEDGPFNIPTVWFVGYFDAQDTIAKVRAGLYRKQIGYFEEHGKYDSFEALNHSYWDKKDDAERFPKFLHQLTKIGLDLLEVPKAIVGLKQLNCLEWLGYQNIGNLRADLKKIESLLKNHSAYYINNIDKSEIAKKEFWDDFQKIKINKKGNGKVSLGSWPHFLFNVCGASEDPRMC